MTRPADGPGAVREDWVRFQVALSISSRAARKASLSAREVFEANDHLYAVWLLALGALLSPA